jgi:hypothetical protein
VITIWAGMPSVVENADRMEKVGRMLSEIDRTLQSPKASQAAYVPAKEHRLFARIPIPFWPRMPFMWHDRATRQKCSGS